KEKGAKEAAGAIAGLGRASGVFQADVSVHAEVRALVDAVIARFSRVDVLVNNAGDLVERRPLLEMSEAVWRRVIDVNLSSTFFVTQAVAPGLVERKRGTIVNMSSVAVDHRGGPGGCANGGGRSRAVCPAKRAG